MDDKLVRRPKREKRVSTSKAALVRAERDRQAIALRAQGMQYEDIAPHIGVAGRAGAYRAVCRALALWRAETIESVEHVVDLELTRLDMMLGGLWDKAVGGDPRAVMAVLAIMNRRARYLGLDAPASAATPDPIADVLGATPEEIDLARRVIARIRAVRAGEPATPVPPAVR